MSAPTVEQIIDAVKDLTHTKWTVAASATLSIYDWLLVFSDELETVWVSSWAVPKVLYYFIRIATIPCIWFSAYHISAFRPPMTNTLCRLWLIGPSSVNLLVSASCNWLFTLRLIALYRKTKILVWSLRIGYVLTWLATTIILGFALHAYDTHISFVPELNICGTSLVTKTMPAIFYAPLGWECFIFGFTAYRAYKDAKLITVAGGRAAPFLIVLYRDGLICFVVLVAARIWNIWIFTTQPVTTFSLGTYLMWTVNVVMTSRVYLNLVWLVKRPSGLTEYQTRSAAIRSGAGNRASIILRQRERRPGTGTITGMEMEARTGDDRDEELGKDTYQYQISKWDDDSITELSTMPTGLPHSRP